jgi:UDP-N-acetylglucosamine--N-acetylmuramyl-(pentapeptide) pyrophosphoryl-undecaprenol N-acetylglucosamine transferase
MSGLRFALACGGTSGHIHPALAIAEKIRRDHPDAEIRFFGTARGLESEVVPRAGFSFTAIRARGFPSKISLDLIKAAADFFAGRRQSRKMLADFRPNAVIGTGGYAAGPVVAAAASLRIPVLLHEQNAYPGRSNRMMVRRSQAVCVSFPGTGDYFPDGTPVTLTGNPVREVFFTIDRKTARVSLGLDQNRPVVLAMGGSQGARSINTAILGLDGLDIPHLQPGDDGSLGPLLILAAGKQHYEAVMKAAAGKGWLDVREYLHDVHLYMAAADLVINRAGSSTCFELAALGKPSILIPYPYATGDHQTYNARILSGRGAALLCPDSGLTPAYLKTELARLFSNPDDLAGMGRAAASLARPDAASAICSRLYEVMR